METWGGQIFLVVVLLLFTSIAITLLVYGMVTDDGRLAILGMSITIPMFLAADSESRDAVRLAGQALTARLRSRPLFFWG